MAIARLSPIFGIVAFIVSIIVSTSVHAQICTGSLGDAVVNVTFGTGTGNPLPRSTTSYNFVSADCPIDGSYTIISSTAACFGNSWHTLPEDHTPGDNGGCMMLVNASIDPGDFYVDTVKGLCASTTYEFSAWVANVLLVSGCNSNGTDPQLVFNIETAAGVVLGTYSTGLIPETAIPQWKQYGLFFTTPVNTNTVVIRITNNAPGGCGNDIALDDITFRPCGPTVAASVVNQTGTSIDFCAANISPVSLSATIGIGYAGPSLQWQESLDNGGAWADIPGATSPNYLFTKTAIGQYLYRLTVAEGANIVLSKCRVASNVIAITIHGIPIVSASSNSPVCESTRLELSASAGATFRWAGPAGFTSSLQSPSFTAEANASGRYDVVVADEFGCVNTASTIVAIIPKPTATVSAGQPICEGSTASISASGGDTFLWSPAQGLSDSSIANPTASPSQTTVYTVSVTNNSTCSDTASVEIFVWQKPTASAGEDKVIIKGEAAVLNGVAGGSGISFSWSPVNFLDNPALVQPTTTITHDTTYTLRVVSNAGCGVATDSVFVKVFNDIYIPSAFSPNNDGRNDAWRIEALIAFPQAVVTVYNRYGEKLFEGSGRSSFWDGTYKAEPQAAGAYIYIIDFKNKRPIKKGWVMLVR